MTINRRSVVAFLVFFLAAPAWAADTPPAVDLQFPDILQPVTPTPPAPPSAVTTLVSEEMYVITSQTAWLILDSPTGLVTITTQPGPITIRSRFAGGGGKVETRTYQQKQVTVVEAVAGGRVELICVPAGATDAKSVVRRLIDVNVGPRPPPVPPGPVPPGPTPQPDGALGLIKASRDGAAKVPASADKAAQQGKLAAAQRQHASAVAAGAFATPAAILDGWRQANNAAVPAAAWGPWAMDVSAAVQSLYKAGRLPDKLAWAAAFEEIAAGLGG